MLLISWAVAIVLLAGVTLVAAAALARRGGRASRFLQDPRRGMRAVAVVAGLAILAATVGLVLR